MADNGRLIINTRGETAQVVPASPITARITRNDICMQISVRSDAILHIGTLNVCTMYMMKQEARALALKLLDACGDAAEVRERETTPRHRRLPDGMEPLTPAQRQARRRDLIARDE